MESVVKIIFSAPLVFHLQKNILWEFYLFIFSFLTVERTKQGGPDNICRKLDSKLRQSEGKLIINLHQSNTRCHRSFWVFLECPIHQICFCGQVSLVHQTSLFVVAVVVVVVEV